MTATRTTACRFPVIIGLGLLLCAMGFSEQAMAQGGALAKKINKAIDAGKDHLAGTVPKGTWLTHGYYSKEYPMGALGVDLAALCRSGHSMRSASIREGHGILMRLPLEPGKTKDSKVAGWPAATWKPGTYDLAFGILGLEAPFLLRKPAPREAEFVVRYTRLPMPEPVLRRMDAMAKALIALEQDGAWSYDATERRINNSTTHCAVLALRVAQRCGVEIQEALWRAIAERQLRDQDKEGPETTLEIVRRPSGFSLAGPDDAPLSGGKERRGIPKGYVTEKVTTRSRGWGYAMYPGGTKENPYSMTLASLSTLAMARDGLRHHGALDAELEDRLRDSLAGGLAYVALEWDEKYLTEDPYHHWKSLTYNLYAFEKFGEISGIFAVNGHPWYYEGAGKLVEAQSTTGAWGPHSHNTALALLFLNRATITRSVSALEIEAIVSGKGGGLSEDMVYAKSLDGMVSGLEALAICVEDASRHNLRCTEEVLEAYPLTILPRLIPGMLLLHDRGGKARKVAGIGLERLTGKTSGDAVVETARSIHEEWRYLLRLRSPGAVMLDPKRIRSALSVDAPVALIHAALHIVEHRKSRDRAMDVLELLQHESETLQVRALATLRAVTGLDHPYDPDAPEATRAQQRATWRAALEKAGSEE